MGGHVRSRRLLLCVSATQVGQTGRLDWIRRTLFRRRLYRSDYRSKQIHQRTVHTPEVKMLTEETLRQRRESQQGCGRIKHGSLRSQSGVHRSQESN